MNRSAGLLVIASAAGAAAAPAPAHACSFAGPVPYAVDSSMQATDHVAPTLPPLTVAQLHRGEKTTGCTSVNSCDDIGSLAIAGAATDDVTAANDIGYRFSLVEGALPPSFSILLDQPSQVLVSDGQLWFHWTDGTDGHEPISFTLQVTAIDRAGNESAPRTVRVSRDGGDGCAVAGGGDARLLGYTVAAALLAVRRRHRRTR
jgi:hypothetical protein